MSNVKFLRKLGSKDLKRKRENLQDNPGSGYPRTMENEANIAKFLKLFKNIQAICECQILIKKKVRQISHEN